MAVFCGVRIARAGRLTALLSAFLSAGPTAVAVAAPVQTLETMVEDWSRPADFDVRDVKATFAFVFNSLPGRVKVYPTENYYYFKFFHRGVPYMGNIRLENGTRDEGKVHFAYEPEPSLWREPETARYALLQASDGLAVEKLAPLEYRLTYGGKSVMFLLNDLSQVKPPPALLAPDERFIGPVFDESGIRFFLLYNSRLRIFHYVLDESVPTPDELAPSRLTDRILIGRRTSFAFYRDAKIDRKILIGVYAGNVRVNSYYDGPFDQLPDNFIDGESLRGAILDVAPRLAGKIDRFGSTPDGRVRFVIAPYLNFYEEDDLALFHRCATSNKVPAARYHACFAVEEADGSRRLPRTIAEGGRIGPPPRKGTR